MGAKRPDVAQRHREQREETHRRILDVSRALLEEHPWSAVSIALVSEQAGLTRTAFYKHFADRQALLLELLDELAQTLEDVPGDWQGGGGEEVLRAAVTSLVSTFQTHGRLLRAIADEAAQNEQVAARYAELGRRLSAGVAARIATENSSLSDPDEVGSALIWMNERFLLERFGRRPLGDPDRAAAALTEVWLRTVYG